jgi:hypothetical protein
MRNAADIYRDLQNLLDELVELEGSGRVVMDRGDHNTHWPDATAALHAAQDAVQRASDATRWMDTLPPLRSD